MWLYSESLPKSDISAGSGYGSFQGHMSAHDMALGQGTQQQGYSSHFALRTAERNAYWPRPSVCLCVSLSVPGRRVPTLLHVPGCNLGER